MPIIKITKGDAKKMHFACDTDDKMDICLYVDGQKIRIEPSSTQKTDDGHEHTFDIGEDVTEELGEGKHAYSVRINSEPVEKGHIVISNGGTDEEDYED